MTAAPSNTNNGSQAATKKTGTQRSGTKTGTKTAGVKQTSAKKTSAKKTSETGSSAQKADTTAAPAQKPATKKSSSAKTAAPAPEEKRSTSEKRRTETPKKTGAGQKSSAGTSAKAASSATSSKKKATKQTTGNGAGKQTGEKKQAVSNATRGETVAPPAASRAGNTETATVGDAIGQAVAAVRPEDLPVRDGEDPWTADELAEVQTELQSELGRLAEQIEVSETELVGLLRDSSEGAGRDPADVGSTNFERDHEISLANNARDLLDQTRLALRHIATGSYGLCDSCGRPIGKGRLQAFPRATLCVECKQREERR